jgi:penicillin-binding protein 1A
MPSQGRRTPRRSGSPRRRRGRRLLLVLAFLLVSAAALGAAGAWFINMDLPDVRTLEDWRPATITRLAAGDGRTIHEFATEKRIVVGYADLAPALRNAIVAAEDSKFFRHVGVDPIGIGRALLKDLLAMRKAQGASTITQQLARGLFLKPDKTFKRKIREAVLAMQIEKTYTKEEIFTFYANQVYMGHGHYGLEAASRFYFNRRARDLTLPQAALLAGIIQRPEDISPLRNPQRALNRRNYVLKRMREEGALGAAEHEAARKAPLQTEPPKPSRTSAAYFIEEVRRDLDARLGEEALYRGGLTIETGLDLDLQLEAERALDRGVREIAKRRAFRLPSSNVLREKKGTLEAYRHPDWREPIEPGVVVTGLVMEVSTRRAVVRVGTSRFEVGPEGIAWTGRGTPDRIFRPGDLAPFLVEESGGEAGSAGALRLELSAEPTLDGAVLAVDPRTGEIRALVGGLDFSRSQFDRAVQALRQPGSAFKPIIYAAALEEGWRASDLLMDEPTVFMDPGSGVPYQPENYYREYNGVVTVRYALEHSLNISTIRMLNQVGYERAVAQARRMGITSKLRPYPALGLGASEVSLIELVGAYSVFPNLGTLTRPRLHTRIRSHDGSVLEETPAGGEDVMRPELAYLMTSLLRGVVVRGTATDAASLGEGIAGKTGTTDDNTDAWFVGFSPSLVVGVWVGKDDKEPIGAGETGSRAALPIWIEIMKHWAARRPAEPFRRPPGVEAVPVDYRTGLKAGVDTGCEVLVLEELLRSDPEPGPCTHQAHLRARLPYYLQRYPWLDAETIALTQADLARVLREAPLEVATEGRGRIRAQGPLGTVDVAFRIVGADDPDIAALAGASALAGAPAPSVPAAGGDGGLLGLSFPADLTGLSEDAASHPSVGLDGRTAAVLRIRYP